MEKIEEYETENFDCLSPKDREAIMQALYKIEKESLSLGNLVNPKFRREKLGQKIKQGEANSREPKMPKRIEKEKTR